MSFKHMRRHAFEQLVNSMLKLQQEITHFYYREALWSSGYSSSIMAQKVAVSREFKARYRHAATGKLSLSTQQKMGTFFELGKDKG